FKSRRVPALDEALQKLPIGEVRAFVQQRTFANVLDDPGHGTSHHFRSSLHLLLCWCGLSQYCDAAHSEPQRHRATEKAIRGANPSGFVSVPRCLCREKSLPLHIYYRQGGLFMHDFNLPLCLSTPSTTIEQDGMKILSAVALPGSPLLRLCFHCRDNSLDNIAWNGESLHRVGTGDV